MQRNRSARGTPPRAAVQGLLGTLRRDSLAPVGSGTSEASRTILAGIDSAGRLWVVGLNPIESAGYGTKPVLEIIDPVRREKVVSTRLAHDFRLLGNSDLAWSKAADSVDVLRITLWRVRVNSKR